MFTKVVIVIVFISSFYLINKFINTINNKNSIELDKLIKDINIDDSILALLDDLINETLDEYILLNVAPKQLVYINNNIQDEITNFLKEEIPNRISVAVLTKLCYKYSKDYIPELIGTRIYIAVLNYTLQFNTANVSNN